MSIISSRSLAVLLGISACGLTGYLVMLLLRKDDDDDDFDGTVRTRNHKCMEIKVPREVVRVLIGRNGKNIKAIQDQSNTRINFRDVDGVDKVCVIRGTAEACAIAQDLVYEFIAKQPILESFDMWVPQNAVGKIIGRCGERINEISTISGAKINVSDVGRNEPTRRIVIKGTKEQVSVAKSLIEDVIGNYERAQMYLDAALAKREPRLPPKSSESPKATPDSPRSERISPLPGQPDAQFEVYVSAMVDPSCFWLQIVGPKATELDQLVEEMTEYYGKAANRELHGLEKVEKGDLVAAIFEYDNKWYRAEVLNLRDETPPQAELYYVDYGDTDIVPCSELYELRTDFLRLHFQAIECFLANIEPANGEWAVEAIDKFEEWTHVAQWKKLSAKMNGYCVREKTRAKREGSPVPGVELFDVNNDQDVDIAQELVNHGYAVFKRKTTTDSPRTATSSVSSVA